MAMFSHFQWGISGDDAYFYVRAIGKTAQGYDISYPIPGFKLMVITKALTLRGLAHSFLLRASAATLASPSSSHEHSVVERHAKIGARQSFYITVERLPLLFLPIRISHLSESVRLESMYILKDPSFSLMNNIGAPQGEELGLTNPFEYTTYYAGDIQLSFSQHITCLRVSIYPAPTYQSYQKLGLLAAIDAYPLLLLLRVVKASSPKGPLEVLSIRESHNSRDSISLKVKYIEGNLLVLLVIIQLE
ncbi:hypothetical protein Tco_0459851 [Tanacetum coccineum]